MPSQNKLKKAQINGQNPEEFDKDLNIKIK